MRLDHGAYRDGVRFRNGKDVSIQQLNSGVTAVVVQTKEIPQILPKVAAFERA